MAARLIAFETELRRVGFAKRGEEAVKERIAKERARILSRRLSGRRIRMILDALSMIVAEAVENGWLQHNPVREMRKRVSAKAEKASAFLTRDELFTLEEATREFESHERLPVLIAAWGGLRKGEVFGLQRRDFDRANSLIRIDRILTRGETTGPKKDSRRVVPLQPWLTEEITTHLAGQVASFDRTDWLFTTGKGGPKRWTAGRSWNKVRRALFAAIQDRERVKALRDGTSETRRLTLHSLRHSCATGMAEGGQYGRARSAVLGYKSMAMTDEYTHASVEAKRAAIAALPDPTAAKPLRQ